jgi:hypothetical protein
MGSSRGRLGAWQGCMGEGQSWPLLACGLCWHDVHLIKHVVLALLTERG